MCFVRLAHLHVFTIYIATVAVSSSHVVDALQAEEKWASLPASNGHKNQKETDRDCEDVESINETKQ